LRTATSVGRDLHLTADITADITGPAQLGNKSPLVSAAEARERERELEAGSGAAAAAAEMAGEERTGVMVCTRPGASLRAPARTGAATGGRRVRMGAPHMTLFVRRLRVSAPREICASTGTRVRTEAKTPRSGAGRGLSAAAGAPRNEAER